jgi:hypothetical protein
VDGMRLPVRPVDVLSGDGQAVRVGQRLHQRATPSSTQVCALDHLEQEGLIDWLVFRLIG